MEEIWKDIQGYEGLYQVSTLGRVKSIPRERTRGSIKYGFKDKDGYMLVHLYKNGIAKTRRVHRLVAQTFIPNLEGKPEVNHKNGVRNDNRLENLEWCTSSENNLHAFRVLHKKPSDPLCKNSKKMLEHIDEMCKEVIQYEIKIVEKARYKSIREAARQTGIHRTSISKCCLKKQKQAGGYIWEFENSKKNN